MASHSTMLRRRFRALQRNLRGVRMVVRAFLGTDHPLLAHIIPVRRCNLACKYCNEFDDFSKPVPVETMFRRVDKLAELGTSVITISGGEPLLHPELDDIIRRIRRHGIIAGLITNGYLLTGDRIERLNRAGLEWLQISIDNVTPDDVSKKSLKVLDKKLQLLAEHADFHVNINSVVGGGVRNPQDALTIGKRAIELGFSSTVGIIHYGVRTSGGAGPAPDICIFAKTDWCTTARSSAAIPRFRWSSTRLPISVASTSQKKPAHPIARFPAFIRFRFLIRGARHSIRRPHQSPPARVN